MENRKQKEMMGKRPKRAIEQIFSDHKKDCDKKKDIINKLRYLSTQLKNMYTFMFW